jgi:copper chaperone CopZ
MMNVTGMKCGGCPIEFSLALKESIGVEDVEISLVRVLRTPPAV